MGTHLSDMGWPEPPAKEGVAYRIGWRSFFITNGKSTPANPFTGEAKERWEQGYADARDEEYEARKATHQRTCK